MMISTPIFEKSSRKPSSYLASTAGSLDPAQLSELEKVVHTLEAAPDLPGDLPLYEVAFEIFQHIASLQEEPFAGDEPSERSEFAAPLTKTCEGYRDYILELFDRDGLVERLVSELEIPRHLVKRIMTYIVRNLNTIPSWK